MSQLDLIARAEAAVRAMLCGMKDGGKRDRATEYARCMFDIANADAEAVDVYIHPKGSPKPIRVDPKTGAPIPEEPVAVVPTPFQKVDA